MRICYKFASRSRPDKFFKTLDNIIAKAKHDDYFIIGSFDIDDKTMHRSAILDLILKYDKLFPRWGIPNGKINAINRDMPLAPVSLDSSWDILIVPSDDVEFIYDGFDLQIISDMQAAFPDGDCCLHYHDGTKNGSRIITVPVMDRKFFNRFGYIYYPEYKTWYADDELTEVAKLLKRYAFCSSLLFKHHYWRFEDTAPDELNIINDSADLTIVDRNLFLERQKNKFYLQ
jgi:hypothetical protein